MPGAIEHVPVRARDGVQMRIYNNSLPSNNPAREREFAGVQAACAG
jgi:hypothetical protein